MNEKYSLFIFYNIKNIFLSFTTLNFLNILENVNSVLNALCKVKGHCSVPLHPALYYRTTVNQYNSLCSQNDFDAFLIH